MYILLLCHTTILHSRTVSRGLDTSKGTNNIKLAQPFDLHININIIIMTYEYINNNNTLVTTAFYIFIKPTQGLGTEKIGRFCFSKRTRRKYNINLSLFYNIRIRCMIPI